MLLIFGRPVDSQADFTERRGLAERQMRDAFGQPFRREPLIVNQSRESFAGLSFAKTRFIGTKLFSLNNKKEYLEYLDAIRAGATPEHLTIVQELYGDGCLTLYTSIYRKENI